VPFLSGIIFIITFLVLNGKILAMGEFTGPTTPTASVEEYTPEGWQPGPKSSISSLGKLSSKWGQIKKEEF